MADPKEPPKPLQEDEVGERGEYTEDPEIRDRIWAEAINNVQCRHPFCDEPSIPGTDRCPDHS